MTLKINPFHQLVWRTPHDLQIGLGPQSATFTGVSQAQERLIDALFYGVPEQRLEVLGKQLRLGPDEMSAVVGGLQGLLITDTGTDVSDLAIGEQARASFRNGKSFSEVLERRRESAVQIASLDATGLTLVLALAAAGVGHILSPDNDRVTQADCATNLYPRALLGYKRFHAAKLILDSSWPGTKLHPAARVARATPKPQLVVLTSHQVPDPAEVGRWRAAELPVLEIRYESDALQVSPVLDGSFGCLLCQAHRSLDLDPDYAAIATQLLESPLRFDDSPSRLIACGIAVDAVLDHLDGRVGDKRAWRVQRMNQTQFESSDWEPHAACSCQLRFSFQAEVPIDSAA